MRHFLLCILLFLGSVCILRAEPAYPYPFYVQQKDGSQIRVLLRGDEHFHYMEADDGTVIVRGEDQSFYYAEVINQSLRQTLRLAHNLKDRTQDEQQFVTSKRLSIRQYIDNLQATETKRRRQEAARLQQATGQRLSYLGKKRGIVLLVDFPDCHFSSSAPQEIANSFSQRGYSNNYHIGSVADYFYDQSYGQFELNFDVVGPFTTQKEMAYYGENSGSDNDIHIGELVDEVIRQADSQVDFSLYDWNNDGEVEQIFIVYAGYAESSGAPSNTIWPHQFTLSGCQKNGMGGSGALTLDGVKIDQYACSSELTGISGTTLRGIGTACHEFSHCLGLPDFYDIKYNGGFGMGPWSLMDTGSYNGPNYNGEVPCGYTAYERWMMGWLELTELSEPERINEMPGLDSSPTAYVLKNDAYPSEYFILENRQPSRWFSYVKQYTGFHGLLITHVDYNEDSWNKNHVNIYPTHQRMTIVPADGNYGTLHHSGDQAYYSTSRQDLMGDLFPGVAGITAFTNDSHTFAGGRLFNMNTDGSKALNKPVTNIREADGHISFDISGGIYVPVPQITDIAWADENRCQLRWTIDSPVDSFEVSAVEVRDNSQSSLLLSENFNNFRTENPDTMELSQFSGLMFQNQGWNAYGIYKATDGMRLSGNSRSGYCTTPPVTVVSSNLTVNLSVLPTDSVGDIRYSLFNAQGDTISEIRPCETAGRQLLVLDGLANDSYRLRIEPDRDVVLRKFELYDAALTEQDLLWSGLIKPLQRKTVTGITTDSLIFPAMNSKKFKLRIRAWQDGACSEWSDYSLVDMNALPVRAIITDSTDYEETEFFRLDGMRVDKAWGKGLFIRKRGDNQNGLFLQR